MSLVINWNQLVDTCLEKIHVSQRFYYFVNVRYSYIVFLFVSSKVCFRDFPGGTVVKNLPANAGDTGSSPGPGRSHMPQSN